MPGKQGTTRERLPSAGLLRSFREQTHLGLRGQPMARRAHSVAPGPSSSVQFDFARTAVEKNVTDVARQGWLAPDRAAALPVPSSPLFAGCKRYQVVIGGAPPSLVAASGATAYASG